MKAQSPLLGFNNNVRHKGRVFHIQTEDSGIRHPHIITHLFADGGRILKTTKTSYAEHIGQERLAETVRAMMQEQHKAMFIALRDGQFDYLFDEGGAPPASVKAPSRVVAEPAKPSPQVSATGSPPEAAAPAASAQALAPTEPPQAASTAVEPEAAKAPVTMGDAPMPPAPATSVPQPVEPAVAALRAAPSPAPLQPAEPVTAPQIPPPPLTGHAHPPESPGPPAQPEPPVAAPAPPPLPLAPPRGVVTMGETPKLPGDPPNLPPRAIVTPPPPEAAPRAPGAAKPPPRPIPRQAQHFAPTEPVLAAAEPAPAGTTPWAPAESPADGARRRAAQRPTLEVDPGAIHGLGSAEASIDLDLDALERAAAEAQTPFFQQIQDLPPPPASVLGSKRGSAGGYSVRVPTPPPPPLARGPDGAPRAPIPSPPHGSRPAAPSMMGGDPAAYSTGRQTAPVAPSPGRYAPSRPASIFATTRPQEGASIFGEDLISEKSLDEVILSYLAEDLDGPAEKK